MLLLCGACPEPETPTVDNCRVGGERTLLGSDELTEFGMTPREMTQMPVGVRTPRWDPELEELGDTVELRATWDLDAAEIVRFPDGECPDFVLVEGVVDIQLPRFAGATTTILSQLTAEGWRQHATRDNLAPMPGEEDALLDLLPGAGEFLDHSWTAIYLREGDARPVMTVTGTERLDDGALLVTPIAAAEL